MKTQAAGESFQLELSFASLVLGLIIMCCHWRRAKDADQAQGEGAHWGPVELCHFRYGSTWVPVRLRESTFLFSLKRNQSIYLFFLLSSFIPSFLLFYPFISSFHVFILVYLFVSYLMQRNLILRNLIQLPLG